MAFLACCIRQSKRILLNTLLFQEFLKDYRLTSLLEIFIFAKNLYVVLWQHKCDIHPLTGV